MDAVDFIRAKERMCDERDCDTCPLYKKTSDYNLSCEVVSAYDPKYYVSVFEEWANNHPTRLQVFLKSFPDSIVRELWGPYVDVCPHELGQWLYKKCGTYGSCSQCKCAYWNVTADDTEDTEEK